MVKTTDRYTVKSSLATKANRKEAVYMLRMLRKNNVQGFIVDGSNRRGRKVVHVCVDAGNADTAYEILRKTLAPKPTVL